MGISVPVSSKHYKELKAISDRLGLGVKRTIEHLITYYCKAEAARPGPVLNTHQHIEKAEKSQEDRRPILVSPESVSRYEILPEVPSQLASRINSRLIEPKDGTSILIPSRQIALQPISKNKLLETSRNVVEDVQKCSACGAPRRKSARFCYNCGNQIKGFDLNS